MEVHAINVPAFIRIKSCVSLRMNRNNAFQGHIGWQHAVQFPHSIFPISVLPCSRAVFWPIRMSYKVGCAIQNRRTSRQIHPKSVQDPTQIAQNVILGGLGGSRGAGSAKGRAEAFGVITFGRPLGPKVSPQGSIWGPLKTKNGSKNRPAASRRALWASKSGYLEGSGKVSKNQ